MAREFPWLRPSESKFLPPRFFGWLALTVAFFTIYGSLVPFQYRWRPFQDALDGYSWVLENRMDIQSRSDFLANFVLGVPLGFALAAWLMLDRPNSGTRKLLIAICIWPCCVVFAAAVEFTQLYFPARTCSGSDIIAQALGSASGLIVFLLIGQRSVDQLRTRIDHDHYRSPAVAWLVLFFMFVALVQWLPFDLTASPADWYRKFRDGKVILVPFSELGSRATVPVWQKVQIWLDLAAIYFPAGLLLAFTPLTRVQPQHGEKPLHLQARRIARVLGIGLLIVLVIELGQIPIQSRTPSITDVILGGLAILIGWLVAKFMTLNAPGSGLDIEAVLILGQAWLLWMAVSAWLPFEFDGRIGASRFRELNWIPLETALKKNDLGVLDEVLTKMILAIPYGVVVSALGSARRARRRQRVIIGAALASVLTLILELGQLYLTDRFANPSDVLYAAFGGAIGAAVTLRLRMVANPESAPTNQTPLPMPKLQLDRR